MQPEQNLQGLIFAAVFCDTMEHEILDSYLNSSSIVQHQLDSYNKFIHIGLQKIIESQSIIEPGISDFSIKFTNIRLESPIVIEADGSRKKITPNEAIIRNLTYSAPIYITYVPIISGIEKDINKEEIFIGELPVMVKSDLCTINNASKEALIKLGEDPDNPGGYFIIKGTERVLIGIEDLAPNRITCTKEKKSVTAKVFSTTLNFRAKTSIVRDEYGTYKIMFPTLTKATDLILILKALGIDKKQILAQLSDQEIINDMILNIDQSKTRDMSQAEAIKELGRMSAPNQTPEYQAKRAENQLDMYLLPHLGIKPEYRMDKAVYLITMAEKASLVAYKKAKQDDKDNYSNKRVKLAGDLMEELFNNAFKFFIKDIKYHIERTAARGRKLGVRSNINPDVLTEKILYSMGTGTWPNGQTGVSQVLERINFVNSISHLRRIKSPLAKKHPHYKARDVHGTHIGKICPSESPEGPEVGLTKYFALTAKVTNGIDSQLIEAKLKELKLI